jgi:hypothetical protein
MTWHQVTHPTSASPLNVRNLLRTRPPAWLRPFLTLSTGLAIGGAHDHVVTTFRLGMPKPIGRHSSRTLLTWCTSNEGGLFTKFNGGFVVRTEPTGTTVTLAGEATGGEADRNQRALESLTQLIAAAASSYYDSGPATDAQIIDIVKDRGRADRQLMTGGRSHGDGTAARRQHRARHGG